VELRLDDQTLFRRLRQIQEQSIQVLCSAQGLSDCPNRTLCDYYRRKAEFVVATPRYVAERSVWRIDVRPAVAARQRPGQQLEPPDGPA